MPKVLTAQQIQRFEGVEEYCKWLRGLARRNPQNPTVHPPSQTDDKAAPAVAYANHGRWVADCPAGCGGAMLVEPGLPFLCAECWNEEIGGYWRRVAWPDDRTAIETALNLRPLAKHQNWRPDETVDDLHRQNQHHGMGVR